MHNDDDDEDEEVDEGDISEPSTEFSDTELSDLAMTPQSPGSPSSRSSSNTPLPSPVKKSTVEETPASGVATEEKVATPAEELGRLRTERLEVPDRGTQQRSLDRLVQVRPSYLVVIEPFSPDATGDDVLKLVERNLVVTNVLFCRHAPNRGIDTPSFWNLPSSESEEPRFLSLADVASGRVKPRNPAFSDFAKRFAEKLLDPRLGRHSLCLRTTDASAPTLTNAAVQARARALLGDGQVREIVYGQTPWTQTLSVFRPVLPVRDDDAKYVDLRLLLAATEVIFCGDAESVHYSVSDLVESGFPADHVSVVENLLFHNACFHGTPGVRLVHLTT